MQSWTCEECLDESKRVAGVSETEKEGMRPETKPINYHDSRAITIQHSPYWSPQFTRSDSIR